MPKVDQETINQLKAGKIKPLDLFKVNAEQYGAILMAGHTLFTEGRYEEARQLFEGLALLDAKNPYNHGMLGAIYQRLGNVEAAIARYSKALSLFSNDIYSLTNRGELLLKTGKLQEAAEDLKKAIALDPEKKHPAANRARLLVIAMAEALKLAREKGIGAVLDAKKRIDEQLEASREET